MKSDSYDINKKENNSLISNNNELNDDIKSESEWKIENVNITVNKDSITKTGAIIVIEDKNEKKVSLEMNFAIQKAGEDDKWVDMITKEVVTWLKMAQKPNEDGITQMQLDWSEIYGELSPGTYRIVKYNALSTLYSEPFIIEK